MQEPTARAPPASSVHSVEPRPAGEPGTPAAEDPVERALAILRATGEGPKTSPEQERACYELARVLYEQVLPRVKSSVSVVAVLDEDDVNSVVYPKFADFVVRHVHRIGPKRTDFERWMYEVLKNGLLTAARKKKAQPADRQVELTDEIGSQTCDTDSEPDEAADLGPEPVSIDNDVDGLPREAQWTDAVLRGYRVNRAKFADFLSTLTETDREIFKMMFETYWRGHQLDRATMAARVGISPNNLNVRWYRLVKRFNKYCRE
jgi:RNA polymerase sigma factor (sigma-70 family)